MAYKTIDETFWTDPDIRMLSIKARHLMLYFMTNPHAHYSGIYYLPKAFIQAETDISMKDINSALKELKTKPSVYYDESRQVIWVVNMFKHQCKTNNVEKMVQGVANHLKTLHKSLLIKDFLKYYKTHQVPFTDPLPTHPEPVPESVAVTVTGEVTVTGTETLCVREKKNRFDIFWQAYPRKQSKGAAEKVWGKIKPSEQLLATMVATIGRAKTSKDWTDENGKFIPHPATWLNAKGWEDELPELEPDPNTCTKCGSTDWQSLTGGLCENCE